MISWIQRSFHHHFKWLFIALLALVIISFVFITNASSGLGRGGDRKLPPRPFFGVDLAKPDQQRQFFSDANLSLYLRFNPQADIPPAELEQYALNRHAALHLAEQLGLPEAGQEAIIAHIRTLRAFAGPDGQFDPKRYAEFTDSLKTNPRITEGDVSRIIAEDVRVAAYEALLAGPGYVLPSDVADILAQRDTTWTLAVASVDGSAFAPGIDTSDTTLRAWFDARAREYQVPARVSVASITVPAAKFADTVTLTDAEVRTAYDANPARYPAPPDVSKEIKLDPATGKDLNADAAFNSVRALVEADLRKRRAGQAALSAASDINVQIREQNIQPSGLAAFLAKHPGLTLDEAGPVGTGAVPALLGGASASPDIATEALRLSAERPYSNPVAIPAGAAILVWRENIAPHDPALSEVREKVLADYQAAEKRRLFSEAGRKLQETVASAIASGKSFAEAVNSAATAAGLKVEVKTPAPFSLSGQFPQDLDYSALQALQTLSKGKVSDFISSGADRGTLVYALDQQIPAADPASTAYTELHQRLADNLGQANSRALISALAQGELAKSAPAVE